MSNLTLWSQPFATDRWVRDFFSPATLNDWFAPDSEWVRSGFSPAAEVAKDGDDALVRLELPGIDVDKDVTVELVGNSLVIHGERRDEYASDDSAKDGRTLREVRYGAFRRSFKLPVHVNSDAISASYDAGVLTVRVTGAYAGAPTQRIAITK